MVLNLGFGVPKICCCRVYVYSDCVTGAEHGLGEGGHGGEQAWAHAARAAAADCALQCQSAAR